MADSFSLGLIAAMDRLWFHQIILFSEPLSLYFPKTLKPQLPYSESNSTTNTSSSLSSSSLAEDISTAVCPLSDQENSAISSPLTPPDDSKNEEVKKRPTRVSLSSNRSRSHSSSPATQKCRRNYRHSTSCSPAGGKLQKSMSCRSLKDLELEEVRGFMDLGFIFKKENINARMISVVPGLLRLGFFKTELKLAAAGDEQPKDDNDIELEEDKSVIRPYLSEAWLIKRPDSPLLNLRVPRVSAAADMKKHLKFWARTVASVVQQEC